MTTFKHTLCLIMVTASVTAFAQSKGEMPFSASSEINKSLRKSWIALADNKFEEANNNTHSILSQDPACGMAYVSLYPASPEEQMENVRKAESARLSADEKLFVEGLKAHLAKQSPETYFEPLMKKYPRDTYLLLWMMFSYGDPEKSIEIGEGLIQRNAKFAPAYNLLGYLYMDQNMAKAETYFDKYIALRPDLANPYDSKGDYMMRAGRIEEAIPLFEKAASLGMTISKNKAERAKAQLRYPKPSDSDAATIEGIIQERFEALKNKNVDALLKSTSDQGIEIFENQRVNVGLPNLRQRLSEMFKNEGTYTKADFTMKSTNGAGPIAVAYGQAVYLWNASETTEATNQNRNVIYILRKHPDGNWKILASHFYGSDGDARPISPEDLSSINKIITGWNEALTPGEELTAKHFDALAALQSSQAIEIFSNQISNIGLPNLRSRWEQYTGAKMETNSLGLLGIEGIGRRAVAWGIGNQNFSLKGSTELQKNEFPWAMILTKEKDDAWRILATHWGK